MKNKVGREDVIRWILVSDRGDRCPFVSVFGRHLGFNSISISAHSCRIIGHRSVD
jgi:hypothetical protein